jgi:hypothetical protein
MEVKKSVAWIAAICRPTNPYWDWREGWVRIALR